MRRCYIDDHSNSEIVTKTLVGECIEIVDSFDFEFSKDGSFTRLHMRCPRCGETWTEHREFQHSDLEMINR